MGVTDLRERWDVLTAEERRVAGLVALTVAALLAAMLGGRLSPTYFLYLFGLAGVFVLLSLGLNVQWGFTGLINFSVAAFFGLGAYGAALMTAGNSPVAGDASTIAGLFVGLGLAAAVAILIGVPTLRLRADYLAIATLGLAEVVRMITLNERQWTAGDQGLRGIPRFFEGWPLLGAVPDTLPAVRFELVPGSPVVLGRGFWQQSLNVALIVVFLVAAFLLLRRAQRSPWGRVLRTIRADEDLAMALGKDTFAFKMQAFVLGSLLMALGGAFFAHLQLFVSPSTLSPDWTFIVWVAVILGGSGSVRGAIFGGFAVVAIQEGTRFLDDVLELIPFLPFSVNPAPLRLLLIGLLIVLVIRFRPQGILPPQRELIWPAAVEGGAPIGPETGVREARRGDDDG